MELTVELGPERSPIVGRVRAKDGTARPFVGYVGLLATVEGFLTREGVGTGVPDAGERRTREGPEKSIP
jgi:hypothetical protein